MCGLRKDTEEGDCLRAVAYLARAWLRWSEEMLWCWIDTLE